MTCTRNLERDRAGHPGAGRASDTKLLEHERVFSDGDGGKRDRLP